MNMPEIRREIASADSSLARLREHRDKLKQLCSEYMVRPEDDDRAQEILSKIRSGWHPSEGIPPELAAVAGGMNKSLPATEAEVAMIEERRALLIEQLPSEAEVAAATKRAEVLATKAAAKVRAAESAWDEFRAALEAAERAATKFANAHSESRPRLSEVGDLVREMGLDVTVPSEFRPDAAQSRLLGLVGQLCRRIGYSLEIDASLAGEVADARRSAEREETAA